MTTEAERLEVLDALADRWPAKACEIGWVLAGPQAEDRWAPKWSARARKILTELEALGLVRRAHRNLDSWYAFYWYPADADDRDLHEDDGRAWATKVLA